MGKKRQNVSPIPRAQRSAHEHVVLVRRERVATLRNRLLTEREIWEQLSTPMFKNTPNRMYTVNPQTDKPYAMATIHNDLAFLKQQAIENSQSEFAEYKAMQLAEIREARRVAWASSNLQMIAKFLELEMKLTGTIDSSITFNQQNNVFLNEDGQPKEVAELSDAELLLIASKAQTVDVIEGKVVKKHESTD